ncbi:kinase-like protein [Suhomyces tanzawaensis NRRL Y-17324]|uniref:non-specific serine/threonine protein kinase n=1 Tax=Suhomyces tanzawaensis NRRL Y-17324 TaxID=984487 RepID=A0A1E4SDE3_9ASCO|nr:kinase-like protein [Suhomyces tanzawaensis NRRL Y-17324]ODV77525.1 kinase-like protein [Suhomyces tanzawaensis NRRL Y-17324]
MRLHTSIVGILVFYFAFVFTSPRLEKVTTRYLSYPEQNPQPPEPTPSPSSFLPLDLRSISDCRLTDLLLVSDIDGNLHGVERNSGALLWTLPIDEPLVRISSNNSFENNQSNILWFVEPYQDGSLFYFTPKFGMNKLPTSIKDLVLESPFSLSGDDKIYTGTRKTSLYSINIHTGEIRSSFGNQEKCPVPNTHYKLQPHMEDNQDTIMIGKTTYELSIYSKLNTNIVWNVTYSQWGPNNIDNDLIMQNQQSLDKLYFTPFHDKSLLAINKDLGTTIWISKLPSLAVNVFDVFHNLKNTEYVLLPHPLKVLNDLQFKIDEQTHTSNNDLVFVNKTSNCREWFAMSFNNYPTLIKNAPISKYQLDLYKLQNEIPVDIEYLKNFRLLTDSQSLVEALVSGIHKTYELTSETMYQPIAKFEKPTTINLIGDGSSSDRKTMGSELMLLDPKRDKMQLPMITTRPIIEEVQAAENSSTIHKMIGYFTFTIARRIIEDVLILGIILYVIFRYLISDFKLHIRSDGKSKEDEEHILEKEEELKRIEVKKPRIFTDNLENSTLKNVPTKSKKVTILTPNESLEINHSEDETADKAVTDTEENTKDLNESEEVTKKKRKRGSRGGKRGGRRVNKNKQDSNEEEEEDEESEVINTKSLVKPLPITQVKVPIKKLQIENNLVISDKILGYGSHGTIVYQGTFENRPVAVKRMLLDFFDIANHEVRLLQESDDHPNVIRYFCSQSSESEKFLYIALELCLCSLEDIVEKPKKSLKLSENHLNEVLHQLVSGLHYLHSLKIVHRDVKPQNILVAAAKNNKIVTKEPVEKSIRLLISDFGLCKKLDSDQSSFRATTQNAALGTSGWRAPELLLNYDLLEISPDTISSISSRHSANDSTLPANSGGKRLTKAIDIFSLGCVFYYILTGGLHPFGDRYLREGNIIKGEYDLSLLNSFCPNDKFESTHLISSMIHANPSMRPSTSMILNHPLFWNPKKRLEFLLKVSDRFEIERRDPPSDLLLKLETHAKAVHRGNWHNKFDEEFIDNLGKYRKYHPEKLMDLLRAIRNKYHHYNDMPQQLQEQMSPLPDGFYKYFNIRFPNLLMEIYFLVNESLSTEHVFKDFLVGA